MSDLYQRFMAILRELCVEQLQRAQALMLDICESPYATEARKNAARGIYCKAHTEVRVCFNRNEIDA